MIASLMRVLLTEFEDGTHVLVVLRRGEKSLQFRTVPLGWFPLDSCKLSRPRLRLVTNEPRF